jgi:predicted PurR-regulated permease PerM
VQTILQYAILYHMEPIKGTDEALQELLTLTRDTNKIVHGMRSRERVANVLRLFYIAFLVLSFYGAYIFAQPYIQQIQEVLKTAQNMQSNIKTNVSAVGIDPAQLQSVLKAFQNAGQ